ncbi:DUF2188 domain-containing protein [Rhizobium sp. S152]|uniref:DUF2188 domain-containing protein n=1 Tax=Rhizobium sp. S152 TaxID=3055038 RepID=UPI000DDEA580|nr:DUF2188 domain-containing protein [Rhizobium sp. S152]MDM9627550.1 DUF2188 domain-containing protein [Rhizobium sp. S152]
MSETAPTHVTYHVGSHDGGWAYRLGDVWSEAYPTHAAAQAAAQQAARRQHIIGQPAEILYQDQDGTWRREFVGPADRPSASVDG